MTNCEFKTCTELIDVRQTSHCGDVSLFKRGTRHGNQFAIDFVCNCHTVQHSNDLCCGSTWLRNQPEAQAQTSAPAHKSICLLPSIPFAASKHTPPRLHSVRIEFETNRLNCQKCCTFILQLQFSADSTVRSPLSTPLTSP